MQPQQHALARDDGHPAVPRDAIISLTSPRRMAKPGRQRCHTYRRRAVLARRLGYIDHFHFDSANGLRQQGHSPSWPRASDEKADGCGSVVIALNASGARWA